MSEERTVIQQLLLESEAVSWWSWRPGIKPLRAFLAGGLLSLLALFLLVSGLTTLIAGILDSASTPVRVAGVVTDHTTNMLGSPQLILRLSQPGFPTNITLVVSPAASAVLTNGSMISVDYAPHQRTPYALESKGQRYLLPDTSVTGNVGQSVALLLFGLLFLPYPALLFFWGWRDLRNDRPYRRSATIVALRAARQTTNRGPGLIPRVTHIWHGVALQLETDAHLTSEVLTFGIRQELHEQLRRGTRVEVCYSPHLRYLYTLKVLHNPIN